MRRRLSSRTSRHSLYLLYCYKSTYALSRENQQLELHEAAARATRRQRSCNSSCNNCNSENQQLELHEAPVHALELLLTCFSGFTGTKVHILPRENQQLQQLYAAPVRALELLPKFYSVYLLYWYKSTNTDAREAAAPAAAAAAARPACARARASPQGTHFTSFTGTKSANTAELLLQLALLVPKCANTDERRVQLDLDFSQTAAQGASQRAAFETGSQFTCFTGTKVQNLAQRLRQVLSVLALLVQKYKN